MQASFSRVAGPIIIAVAIGLAAWLVSTRAGGRDLSFSLLTGAAFGMVLQRARFCFFCNFRDFVERREVSGLLAIIVALAGGVVLYHIVMMAWVPMPQTGSLPPNAHIGPVGPVLALAAFVFGIGMVVSGSCLSAHLYRLGEGSPISLFALLGSGLGFFTGFLTWNPLYLAFISESPAAWLPHRIGYTATVLLSLGVCAILALVVLRHASGKPATVDATFDLRSTARRVFIERWPPVFAGLAISVVSAFAYLRVAPLGVTAELGSIVRTAGSSAGLLPDMLHGLDGLRGCATAVKQALLSPNGLFVAGLVLASFAAALAAGQFRPRLPTVNEIVKGIGGGILMGWGAMTALGCTVGVLLSGIHAGAVSGWVFLAFCTLGVWLGLAFMRRMVLNALQAESRREIRR